MVATALVLVTEYYAVWWITLPAITMIAREIIISSLREWMAELGKRNSVAVSWMGKSQNHGTNGGTGGNYLAAE